MHHQLQIKIQSALLCCSTRFEEIHIFSHPISGTDVRGLFGTYLSKIYQNPSTFGWDLTPISLCCLYPNRLQMKVLDIFDYMVIGEPVFRLWGHLAFRFYGLFAFTWTNVNHISSVVLCARAYNFSMRVIAGKVYSACVLVSQTKPWSANILDWMPNLPLLWGSIVANCVEGSPGNMTPLGIGKSVIQTECHNNQSFLLQEGPFWDQKTVI